MSFLLAKFYTFCIQSFTNIAKFYEISSMKIIFYSTSKAWHFVCQPVISYVKANSMEFSYTFWNKLQT